LHDEGVLVIAAAGNRGLPDVDYPAAYPSVIGVGAVDDKAQLSTFSSHGVGMAMVAPGVNIASTVPRGFARAVDIDVAGITLTAQAVVGSPLGNAVGEFVWCGYAFPGDCPPQVAGRIAVVRRAPGPVTHYFYEKVLVAQEAGAIAVVILNTHDKFNLHNWSLDAQTCDSQGCRNPLANHQWPLTVGMSYPEGERLLERMGQPIDVSYRAEHYDILSGTSMAAPYVVGAAALLWSLAPDATANHVRAALELSTVDLGPPGRDPFYGAGMLDVIAAAKRLAPEKFGLTPIPPARRRAGGH
jgi:serine protease